MRSEKRARHFAAEIIGLPNRAARRAALNAIRDPKLRAHVRLHVEYYFATRGRCALPDYRRIRAEEEERG